MNAMMRIDLVGRKKSFISPYFAISAFVSRIFKGIAKVSFQPNQETISDLLPPILKCN